MSPIPPQNRLSMPKEGLHPTLEGRGHVEAAGMSARFLKREDWADLDDDITTMAERVRVRVEEC